MRATLLDELALVIEAMNARLFSAQFHRKTSEAQIFLSHSSEDKVFVRALAMDLATHGYRPWLDEWKILAGDRIQEKLAAGLQDSNLVVVVLSQASVQSTWVETEWHAAHWAEVNHRRIRLIPVLLEDCSVPLFLQSKKYADFRTSYSAGLAQLCHSIATLHEEAHGG